MNTDENKEAIFEVIQEDSAFQQDLRLELRLKNNILWKAIHKEHGSVSAFCKAHKELQSKQSPIGQLLNLKVSPFKIVDPFETNIPEYRKLCLTLERILKIPAEELFPRELYLRFVDQPTVGVVEVSSFAGLPSLARKQVRLLPDPNQDVSSEAQNSELAARINRALKTLSYREREIIKLSYGLGDGYSYSAHELANIFKVSVTRVQQIQRKAMQKLQQPSRSQDLVGFLD